MIPSLQQPLAELQSREVCLLCLLGLLVEGGGNTDSEAQLPRYACRPHWAVADCCPAWSPDLLDLYIRPGWVMVKVFLDWRHLRKAYRSTFSLTMNEKANKKPRSIIKKRWVETSLELGFQSKTFSVPVTVTLQPSTSRTVRLHAVNLQLTYSLLKDDYCQL